MLLDNGNISRPEALIFLIEKSFSAKFPTVDTRKPKHSFSSPDVLQFP